MKVGPPSAALAAGFKKIGETLGKEWADRAGAEGAALLEAYRKM